MHDQIRRCISFFFSQEHFHRTTPVASAARPLHSVSSILQYLCIIQVVGCSRIILSSFGRFIFLPLFLLSVVFCVVLASAFGLFSGRASRRTAATRTTNDGSSNGDTNHHTLDYPFSNSHLRQKSVLHPLVVPTIDDARVLVSVCLWRTSCRLPCRHRQIYNTIQA